MTRLPIVRTVLRWSTTALLVAFLFAAAACPPTPCESISGPRCPTSTVISARPNPSVVGESVHVTSRVKGLRQGDAAGSVTVSVDDGSGATCVAAVGPDGLSACDIKLTRAGSKTLNAAYSPADREFEPSSGTVLHQVNAAGTSTQILSDGPDPSEVGQVVRVRNTVTVVAPGSGIPTGTVTVTDGLGASCSAPVGSIGGSECDLMLATSGARALTAKYSGDPDFLSSSSAPESHQVGRAGTTTVILSDSPDPSVAGQVVHVKDSVSVAAGSGVPTGTVMVSDGSGASCSAPLGANGVSQCDLTLASAGVKTLTALYSGDARFDSSSGSALHDVAPAATATIIASDAPDPSGVGQLVHVTASVAVLAPGSGTPTGTVTVSDSASATCSASVGTTGMSECDLTFTSAGSKTLTATYSGAANFRPSSTTAQHEIRGAKTWTGAASTDWSNPVNWSLAAVPTCADSVVIDAAPNQPVLTGSASAGDLTIARQGRLNLAGRTLSLCRDLKVHGVLTTVGTDTVAFVGLNVQTVSFDDPNVSAFGNVRFDNADQVLFATDAWLKGSAIVPGDNVVKSLTGVRVRIDGDLNDPGGDWAVDTTAFTGSPRLPSSLATNVVFTGHATLKDDVHVTGGLTVRGGGQLVLNGHTVSVSGPSRLIEGLLVMENRADVLDVRGDVTFKNVTTPNTRLTAGTLRVAGAFGQLNCCAGFVASGTHKVVFDGTGLQDVSFQDPGSHFNAVELAAGSSVRLETNATALGSVRMSRAELSLNGHSLVVGDSFSAVNAILVMENAADHLVVRGAVDFNDAASPDLRLTAGELVVGGSFRGAGFVASGSHKVGFEAADSVTVRFDDSTSRLQNVDFTNPVSITLTTNTWIAGDVVANGDGYVRSVPGVRVRIDGNLDDAGADWVVDTTEFTGSPRLPRYLTTNAVFTGQATLQDDLDVISLTVRPRGASSPRPRLTLGGHTVSVGGSLRISKGALNMRNAADVLNVVNASFDHATVLGHGASLTVSSVNADSLLLDNLPFVIQGGTITKFDRVTFQNLDPATTQLTINHPGAPNPFAFDSLSFRTTSTAGFYVCARDVLNDANILTINLAHAQPANGSGKTCTSGGAVVNWGSSPVSPASVVISDGDNQTGLANFALNIPPAVLVRDAANQPVANVPVTFTVVGGGGSVIGGNATTDQQGIATVGSWIVRLGSNALTATVLGSGIAGNPVIFSATGVTGSYHIDVRFLTPINAARQAAFANALAKWETLIYGDVPDIPINLPAGSCQASLPAINETVDDVIIFASVDSIDGPGAILGRAGPCLVRGSDNLPLIGVMVFDSADVAALESNGLLGDVILHEMGHVLGLGTVWSRLLVDGGGSDPHFVGQQALAAFEQVGGVNYTAGAKVPVENSGGGGTRDAHWRESVFNNELMTGYINFGANPLSLVTTATMGDLSYRVNYAGADPYSLAIAVRAQAVRMISLGDDRLRIPVTVVDAQGRVERVIAPH